MKEEKGMGIIRNQHRIISVTGLSNLLPLVIKLCNTFHSALSFQQHLATEVTGYWPVEASETKQRLMNWGKLRLLVAEAISTSLLFLAKQVLITLLMRQHGTLADMNAHNSYASLSHSYLIPMSYLLQRGWLQIITWKGMMKVCCFPPLIHPSFSKEHVPCLC